MNEEYWKRHYKNADRQEPSDFARFCFSRIPRKSRILDVGAGDGRDAALLSNCGHVTMIEPNNDLASCAKDYGIAFFHSSFKDFAMDEKIEVLPRAVIYARWFLHAVTPDVECMLLDYAQEKKAMLMAEFRVFGDTHDDTHDRRLIDPVILTKKLLDRNFIINHLSTGRNYSAYGKNNPLLGRVIAQHEGR